VKGKTLTNRLLNRTEMSITCSICTKPTEYGNNAMPINDGMCCDECNTNVVMPARMKEGMTFANFKTGTLITDKEMLEDYDNIVNTKWGNKSSILWTYLADKQQIGLYDIFDIQKEIPKWKKLVKNGHLVIRYSNNRQLEIKGKKWYVFVMEAGENGKPFEYNQIDRSAALLCNNIIRGIVMWFEAAEARDMIYGCIVGNDEITVIDERTDKSQSGQLLEAICCDGKCKPRYMMGRSWWKRLGFNTACVCAENLRTRIEEDKKQYEEREKAERERLAQELIEQEEAERKQRKASPPKKEECPLSPAELKAIPPRPPAKLRSPAGSLIDNKAKQQQWDNKYAIYRKWLK
jgi:hypothetical protein